LSLNGATLPIQHRRPRSSTLQAMVGKVWNSDHQMTAWRSPQIRACGGRHHRTDGCPLGLVTQQCLVSPPQTPFRFPCMHLRIRRLKAFGAANCQAVSRKSNPRGLDVSEAPRGTSEKSPGPAGHRVGSLHMQAPSNTDGSSRNGRRQPRRLGLTRNGTRSDTPSIRSQWQFDPLISAEIESI